MDKACVADLGVVEPEHPQARQSFDMSEPSIVDARAGELQILQVVRFQPSQRRKVGPCLWRHVQPQLFSAWHRNDAARITQRFPESISLRVTVSRPKRAQ